MSPLSKSRHDVTCSYSIRDNLPYLFPFCILLYIILLILLSTYAMFIFIYSFAYITYMYFVLKQATLGSYRAWAAWPAYVASSTGWCRPTRASRPETMPGCSVSGSGGAESGGRWPWTTDCRPPETDCSLHTAREWTRSGLRSWRKLTQSMFYTG